MENESLKILADLRDKYLDVSHTGRTFLPNRIYKKMALIVGGAYEDLNNFQKLMFRSDANGNNLREFNHYKNL